MESATNCPGVLLYLSTLNGLWRDFLFRATVENTHKTLKRLSCLNLQTSKILTPNNPISKKQKQRFIANKFHQEKTSSSKQPMVCNVCKCHQTATSLLFAALVGLLQRLWVKHDETQSNWKCTSKSFIIPPHDACNLLKHNAICRKYVITVYPQVILILLTKLKSDETKQADLNRFFFFLLKTLKLMEDCVCVLALQILASGGENCSNPN